MNAGVVRLIAGREVRQRGRARSFRITLVISVLVVIAAVVLPKALSRPTRPLRLGVVGAAIIPVDSLAKAVNRQIIVTSPPSAAAAGDLLATRQLDVAVIGDQVETRVQAQPSDTSATSRLALSLATVLGIESSYRAAGLTPTQVNALLHAPPAKVSGLRHPAPNRTRQQVTTLIGIVLLFSSIQLYGTWILFGVVEEKSSRVVEILLATVRTSELLTGKIIGIGLLAVSQVVLIAGAALTASAISGSNVLSGASGTTVIGMVGWFVLGYAYYACLAAAGGSLVGRQEEAQNVLFPITLPLLVAYITSFSAVFSTPSPFVVGLSFLPPTAPIAMPVRLAAGGVPLWQVGLSVGLLLAGTAGVVWVAARVYDRAILRTGGRITWRAALRSSAV